MEFTTPVFRLEFHDEISDPTVVAREDFHSGQLNRLGIVDLV
jgi:hypothetical protein